VNTARIEAPPSPTGRLTRKAAVQIGAAAVLLLASAGYVWLLMGPYAAKFEPESRRFLLFGALSVGGGLLLKLAYRQISAWLAVVAAALAAGSLYRLAVFLPEISTYPLSLGWSEASRYYYASLFLSEKIYGLQAPLSVLHPTRYLMQAAPFLLGELPLAAHRIWQVGLWLVTSALVGWLLAKRIELQGKGIVLLFILGAALFLLQGPVYYHLLVMPAIVLAGWDRSRLWRTLLLVLAASLWAGLSRINWAPVPGMLTAALYLLEEPRQGRSLIGYLVPPAAWFIGGSLAALLAQNAYQALSGNPSEYFGTSFSSDLLWYRLLPSTTYPLGVLKAALVATVPGVVVILLNLLPGWRRWHPIRLLGLAAILGVLFAGGVVVSVKIGGGSNLHNLDAFLLLLLVIGTYIHFGRFHPDSGEAEPERPGWLSLGLGAAFGLAALVPLYFTLTMGGAWQSRDAAGAYQAIEAVRGEAEEAAAGGRQVLFISERHLLTFGEIRVPLVEEYEKVFLMEMAMAGSQPYLEAFQQDLQSHRFALIVSEPLYIQYQGRTVQFGEENDAWVRAVAEPLLCYYKTALSLAEFNLQVLIPAEEACQ
jgi:hypothetical protein